LTHFQTGRQSIFNNTDYQKIIDWVLTTNTKGELYNNSSGHILSMVLDFVKTGLGAANLLVDDPIPARNSDNLKACYKAWKLFTKTLLSRLNNKETGNICVVSQRLCETDIVGHVIEAGYTTLTLQAIADEPQVIVYPLSGIEWFRDKGDILNPALESLETLMEIKRTDEDTFNSQYQQRPSATKGGVIDSKNFGKYLQPQDRYQEIVLSVDSASSLSDKAANWGLTIWGKYQVHGFNHLDLLYSVAQKYDYVGGLEKIRQLIKDKGVTLTLIENKSTGLALIPQLKSEGYNVGLIQPVKSKQDRGNSAAPFCNSGRLLIPDTSHLPFTERWLSLFIYEMDGFGSGARKCDLFDSTTQVVNYYNSGGFNVRNFYRLN
jgi:phage terminase large subunit-like protein